MRERKTFSEQLKEMSPPTLAYHLREYESRAFSGLFATGIGLVGFGISLWSGYNNPEEFLKSLSIASLAISTYSIILGSRIGIPALTATREILAEARGRNLAVGSIPHLPFFHRISFN